MKGCKVELGPDVLGAMDAVMVDGISGAEDKEKAAGRVVVVAGAPDVGRCMATGSADGGGCTSARASPRNPWTVGTDATGRGGTNLRTPAEAGARGGSGGGEPSVSMGKASHSGVGWQGSFAGLAARIEDGWTAGSGRRERSCEKERRDFRESPLARGAGGDGDRSVAAASAASIRWPIGGIDAGPGGGEISAALSSSDVGPEVASAATGDGLRESAARGSGQVRGR